MCNHATSFGSPTNEELNNPTEGLPFFFRVAKPGGLNMASWYL